jgi:hypothetical protein
LASPSTTSEKLTIAVGNSDTVTSPRTTGSRPVTLRICAMTALRTVSVGTSFEAATRAPIPAAKTAAITRLNRRRPEAKGTGAGSGQEVRGGRPRL